MKVQLPTSGTLKPEVTNEHIAAKGAVSHPAANLAKRDSGAKTAKPDLTKIAKIEDPAAKIAKSDRGAKTTEPDPSDFGAKLRQARVSRGVSLEKIAEASKISISVLEDLERNEISRLPQGVLGRGFIRSYAAEVGLESEATVAEFVARFPTESVTAGYQTLEQQIEEEQVAEKRQWSLPSLGRWAGSSLGRWPRPSPILMALAAGVILLAACPVYFVRRERSRPHVTTRNTPGATKAKAGPRELASRPATVATPAGVETRGETTASSVTSTEGPATEKPSLEKLVAENRAIEKPAVEKSIVEKPPTAKPAAEKLVAEKRAEPPVERATAGKPATEEPATEKPVQEKPSKEKPANEKPAAEAARARLAVVVSVTRPSWIIASVDGKKTVNRLLQVGEQESLDANRDVLLTTGDAGAVVMTVNGATARPIGRPGESVTVRVNPTNVKKLLAR